MEYQSLSLFWAVSEGGKVLTKLRFLDNKVL